MQAYGISFLRLYRAAIYTRLRARAISAFRYAGLISRDFAPPFNDAGTKPWLHTRGAPRRQAEELTRGLK